MTNSDMQHFWSPPDNETIVTMTLFQDTLVLATTNSVYVLVEHGKALPDWNVYRRLNGLRK